MDNAVVTNFVNSMHREPGKQHTGHTTIRFEDAVRGEGKPFFDRIRAIAEEHVPGFKPWYLLPGVTRPPISVELRTATRELLAGKPQSLLAIQIRTR